MKPSSPTFSALLARHANQTPQAIALVDTTDRPASWHELHDDTRRLAALLHANGMRAGDRLALWLPSGRVWLQVFLACAHLGVLVVAMNTRFRSHEVGALLARSQCNWLALWPSFKDLPFAQILADIDRRHTASIQHVLLAGTRTKAALLPGAHTVLLADAQSHDPDKAPEPAAPGASALVFTTSGTTSAPKMVVHDAQTLLRHGHDVAAFFDIQANDVVLLSTPLCGTFGFSTALGALSAGARLISTPVLEAETCARLIESENVTVTFANNEFLARIMDCRTARKPPFPSLKLVGYSRFAPAQEQLPDRLEQAGITTVGLYGSSELQALCAGHSPDEPAPGRHQDGGRLVAPEAVVRVRDATTGQLLPAGEPGELEIKAPSLMRCYLDDPDATQQAIDNEGFFRTGDLGHTQDGRSFVFLARRGDFLRLGGFLVNPLEIERFMESQSGVAQCQAVGVALAGKTALIAFIIAEPGHAPDENTLIASCRKTMAGYKVPRRIFTVAAFPVVEGPNSSKIQRNELQRWALELLNSKPQAPQHHA